MNHIKPGGAHLLSIPGAFVASLLFSLSGAAVAQQVETTTACDEGTIAEPVELVYGNATTSCAIDPGSDTDRFFFAGVANDQVRVRLAGLTTNLDPVVEVRDGANTLLETSNCVSVSNTRCSTQFDVTLPATGDYLIIVLDSGADNVGDYQLGLERLVADSAVTVLPYDASISDTLDAGIDVDAFHFEAAAGTQLEFNVVALSLGLDPRAEVRDPNGVVIVAGDADGAACNSATNTRCSFRVAFEPGLSGRYSLIVYDENAFDAGDYSVSLWCAYGACPDAPTPDPDGPVLDYDTTVPVEIEVLADADFLSFDTVAGAQLRLNLVTQSTNLDPRVVIRDPNGELVVNGFPDGAGCNSASNTLCSFSVALAPQITGTYSVAIFDDDSFNTGSVVMSLWCVFGDCGAAVTPDQNGPALLYVPTTPDVIEPLADSDLRTFNATAGTSLRLRLNTQTTNLDPRIEVRDPTGVTVINGFADGAGCNAASNTFCWVSVDFDPLMSGTYSVMVFDNDGFDTGAYEMALWCVLGQCDGDGDLFVDGDREVLAYDTNVADNLIDTVGDADYYEFMGTDGDEIRITVVGQTLNLDPRIEVRDPLGALVTDGVGTTGCNSASNTTCSLAYTIMPSLTGTYSLMIYDNDSFDTGDYDVALACLFGTGPGFTCNDLNPAPLLCADNCSSVVNVDQRDTNMDGAGNLCDADLNGDLIVNVIDLGLFRERFFTADPEADFNNDGVVNVIDLGLLRLGFFLPPGPSCAYPNLP